MVNRQRNLWLFMLISGGVLLLLAGILSVNAFQAPRTVATPTSLAVAEITRISVDEAKTAYDHGTAVFVDVRDSSSYEQSHIPGALLVPLSELAEHLDELNPSSWIITYCT